MSTVIPRQVHRTTHIRLRLTRRQVRRCYGLLRSAGDVWAWLLDTNRQRYSHSEPTISNYQELCRELTRRGTFGELSMVGARSVLRRYADAGSRPPSAAGRGFPPVCGGDGGSGAAGVGAGAPRRELPPPQGSAGSPGQRGSRRWRRHRARLRRVEARHRRRVHLAHHEAARNVVAFAVQQRVGTLLVGDPRGITKHDAGRVQNWRLRQWRRTHLLQTLRDKAELAGIVGRLVDERGTSSTCPACQRRVPKPTSRRFSCPFCTFQGHRDLVGAHNIAAKAGGRPTSAGTPALVEHRRAGMVPARRDRRRHLHDQRRRSCLASGHPDEPACSPGRRSPHTGLHPGCGEDQAEPPAAANVA
jgi:IS605 OrfB family transposase